MKIKRLRNWILLIIASIVLLTSVSYPHFNLSQCINDSDKMINGISSYYCPNGIPKGYHP